MSTKNWALIGILCTLFDTGDAHGMPLFARKLNVPCETCHTTIPALNETGYKFRAAGFRLPETIGKPEEEKFELGNYFSARLQARLDTQFTNQPNGAAGPNLLPSGEPGPRTTTNTFSFQEATLYPLTGSWGKYLGSLVELSVSPEDFFEVENAYVRFVKGNAKNFFTARAGVFHPWEGYGASDRPYSNARTLFQTTPISAGGKAVPFVFQPWGLDEVGLELGEDISKLSLRAAILSGTFMRWEEDANAFLPFPAQTGPWKGANQAVSALGKPFNSVAHSTPDFSANATYLLDPNGGGITLLYYRGNISTPTKCIDGTSLGKTNPTTGTVCTGADADFTATGGAFRNNFDRVAAYASYPIGKRFLPLAGFQYGRDTLPTLAKFDSKGVFVDGVFFLHQYLTAGFRYDWFHPNTSKLNTQLLLTVEAQNPGAGILQ